LLEASDPDLLDEPTEPPLRFGVLRSYSERRHGALFDRPEPLVSRPASEVDRYFGGVVPELAEEPLVPTASPAHAHPAARARRAGKDLYVELRVEPEEARRGGIFQIHIPVVTPCPRCSTSTDEESRLACRLCHGAHQLTTDRVVEVTAPPAVAHGQVARIAMEDVGLEETDLVVVVLIN
jgi:DnaJ-class molecular chaperone